MNLCFFNSDFQWYLKVNYIAKPTYILIALWKHKSKGFLYKRDWAQGHPDEYAQLVEKKHKLLSAISGEQGS